MSSPKKTSKAVNSKQDLIMRSLHKFYKESDNIDKLLKIVNGESKLSLRIIDWFVTNYTKERGTIYYIPKKNSNLDLPNPYSLEATNEYPKPFMVNARYKSQLDGFQKKLFDPFCRRKRIIFKYNDNNSLETTVAQLNFFKWAIDNKILDYIKDNLKEIEVDMNTTIKKHSPKTQKVKKKSNKKHDVSGGSTKRRKRRELSTSANKTLNKHKFNIVLDFS